MSAFHFHYLTLLRSGLLCALPAAACAAEKPSLHSSVISPTAEVGSGGATADPAALAQAGQRAAASVAAERLLCQSNPYQILRDNLGAASSIWRTRESGGRQLANSEGWLLVNLAAAPDPAACAARLRQAARKFVGDEGVAFSAFLAVGISREIVSEDLKLLDNLTPEGKLRCLVGASLLLPPAVLPVALCQEAWAHEAKYAFQDTTVTAGEARRRGLDYLDRSGTRTWQGPLDLTEAWPVGDGSIIGWNQSHVVRLKKVPSDSK